MVRDQLEELLHIKTAHHHLRGPCIEGALHQDHHAVDVEERQVYQKDVMLEKLRYLPWLVGALSYVHVEVRVGQHDAL